MVAIGGLDAIPAFLTAIKALLLHEAGDAVAAVLVTVFAELIGHARAAISLAALGVDSFNLLAQTLVLPGASTGSLVAFLPVIVAAGRDVQHLAKQLDGVVLFHRVDPLVALEGGSERMPRVFFRMSRCSRR